MLRPEPETQVSRELGIMHDDVHLRVVEERVLVQVRRADGQPAIVDDPDLRVDIYLLPADALLDERARQKASCAGVGFREDAELPSCVLRPVHRVRGEQDDEPELVGRWVSQLLCQYRDKLRRPEELALEIDEALCRAQGTDVALEEPEVAAGHAGVDVVRDRAHDLNRRRADLRRRRRLEQLAGRLLPAEREVRGDVRRRRAFDPCRCVMPADSSGRQVCRRVEAVAAEVRQVEPADERDPPVEDHELLVVAVHRSLPVVESARDSRPTYEPLPQRARLRARRMEKRQRCSRPHEYADVGVARLLREQLAQGRASHSEVGREVPAGEPDRRARAANRVGDRRDHLAPVDEDIHAVAVAGRGIAAGPAARLGVEYMEPAVVLQPPAMVRDDHSLEPFTERRVDALQKIPHATVLPMSRKVGIEEARRIAVRAALLDGSARSVLDIVQRLGTIQIDPISTVAPPQYLVLWSRLGPYKRAALDRLLWQQKKLFEWNAFIYPIESLPLIRARMREPWGQYKWQRWAKEFLQEQAGLRRYVLRELERRGPLLSRELEHDAARADERTKWWGTRAHLTWMLELLHRRGRLAVVGRRDGQRLWDLAERWWPETETVPLREARKILEEQRRRAVGVWRENGEWRAHEDIPDDPVPDRATLLSPFDRLIKDRDRLARLWDFRYRLEMYVPKAKREFGYYVLPLLVGDRIVGRAEPRFDRKTGELELLGAWGDTSRLDEALASLGAFLGAKS